jgi:hypothetical protein
MTKVIVDPVLRAKLNDLTDQVELCDADRRTLGHFLPPSLCGRLLYASIQVPFVEEEIARRRQATGGRSLAASWNSLGRT